MCVLSRVCENNSEASLLAHYHLCLSFPSNFPRRHAPSALPLLSLITAAVSPPVLLEVLVPKLSDPFPEGSASCRRTSATAISAAWCSAVSPLLNPDFPGRVEPSWRFSLASQSRPICKRRCPCFSPVLTTQVPAADAVSMALSMVDCPCVSSARESCSSLVVFLALVTLLP